MSDIEFLNTIRALISTAHIAAVNYGRIRDDSPPEKTLALTKALLAAAAELSHADLTRLDSLASAHLGAQPNEWKNGLRYEINRAMVMPEFKFAMARRLEFSGILLANIANLQPAPIAIVESDQSRDATALAIFMTDTDLTKREIAKRLNCNEGSLRNDRCPMLAAAMAAHRAPNDPARRQIRRSKSKNGDIEAYEEE